MKLASFFSFGSKKIVTLDIGCHTIKLAEFSVKRKQVILEHFAFLPVPEECVTQEGLTEMEIIIEPFSNFVKQNVQGSFSLYAAIGGRAVIIKKIEVPRVEKEIMNELVEVEVRQNLPFNIEDINYHYDVLSALQPNQEDRLNILLVVAKKNVVENYDRLIKSSGYECDRVDVGGFAIAACLRHAHPEITQKDKNVLVLDIGKIGTVFMVLHSGHLIFEHYVSVGGDTYKDHLMRQMDISVNEAESLKISSGANKEVPEEVQKILTESNYQLCDEIYVANEYFNNHFTDLELSTCYITGGGSCLPDLKKVLAEKLNMPVQVLNPLKAIECSPQIEDSLQHIKYFAAVPIGLCFRGQEDK